MSVDAIEGVEYDRIVQNGPKKVILYFIYAIYNLFKQFILHSCCLLCTL